MKMVVANEDHSNRKWRHFMKISCAIHVALLLSKAPLDNGPEIKKKTRKQNLIHASQDIQMTFLYWKRVNEERCKNTAEYGKS